MKIKIIVLALIAFLLLPLPAKVHADVNATTGFKDMATPTITVVASEATRVGTLPAFATNFTIFALSGDINYGDSGVSSTTSNLYIPAGTMKEFDNIKGRNPLIYLILRTEVATETGTVIFGAR